VLSLVPEAKLPVVHAPNNERTGDAQNPAGGFVDIDRDRDLEACAVRKLKEKTGMVSPSRRRMASCRQRRAHGRKIVYRLGLASRRPVAAPQHHKISEESSCRLCHCKASKFSI
jgi:hypothetical protein